MLELDKIKIKKNVPIPERYGRKSALLALFKKLEIDDCIEIPGLSNRATVYNIAERLGIKITIRKIGSLTGIWRIK